jgi:hypothetical protein
VLSEDLLLLWVICVALILVHIIIIARHARRRRKVVVFVRRVVFLFRIVNLVRIRDDCVAGRRCRHLSGRSGLGGDPKTEAERIAERSILASDEVAIKRV